MKKIFVGLFLSMICAICMRAQQRLQDTIIPVMETGIMPMPKQWIDQDTRHRVFKISNRLGSNRCFYFHYNPFVDNEMIFHGTVQAPVGAITSPGMGNELMQMFAVNLETLRIRQLTNELYDVDTEVVCAKTKELFYQHNDTIFCLNIKKMSKRIVTVMPKELRGTIYTVNCNGTILAGVLDCPEMDKFLLNYPNESEHFRVMAHAKIVRTIFTIDIRSGKIKTVFNEEAWIRHLQFSPIDPSSLMFCHDGPWHEVDRIWTINVCKNNKPRLMHKRTMDNEIAGHEWWGADGKYVFFDLQKPVGENFYLGKVNVRTGKEEVFQLQRHEWSVHFNSSSDGKFLAGDGGPKNSVAASPNGQWIYLYEFMGNKLRSTRLVNMKHSNYRLSPNTHFSPDNQWVIFQSDFEGRCNIYAVEIN